MCLFESFLHRTPYGGAQRSGVEPFDSAQGEESLHAERRRGTPLRATLWSSGLPMGRLTVEMTKAQILIGIGIRVFLSPFPGYAFCSDNIILLEMCKRSKTRSFSVRYSSYDAAAKQNFSRR
jgi:hypothetical protein